MGREIRKRRIEDGKLQILKISSQKISKFFIYYVSKIKT